METKILSNKDDYISAIEEEKANWVMYVLESMGMDMELVNDGDSDEVFEYLMENNIDIIDFPDLNAVRILYGSELVGEWGQPNFLIRKNSETKESYYEITIENWTIFDEGMEDDLGEMEEYLKSFFEDDYDYDDDYEDSYDDD